MAYSSVEGMLYPWFSERGLYPGKLGSGDIRDLAERITEQIQPFRNLHRALEGWSGYELVEAIQEARTAEKAL